MRDIFANGRRLASAIPTWMADLIERAPDSAIQILLSRQLSEELGRDHPDAKRCVKLDCLLSALKGAVDTIDVDASATTPADDRDLAPGQRWLEGSGQCLRDPCFAASVGALVAAKYRSEELSAWLGIMLRRQSEIAEAQDGWLDEHADRQAGHAADVENLLVITASDRERAEAMRGAQAFDARLWTFLDELHRRRHARVAA